MKTYQGGCHCGGVKFELKAMIDKAVLCNCSICYKKGFLHFFVNQDSFKLLTPKENLSLYQFNTKQAKHFFCKSCGVQSYYIPRSHPDQVDVNLRCVDGVELSSLPHIDFDGANWESSIDKLKSDIS